MKPNKLLIILYKKMNLKVDNRVLIKMLIIFIQAVNYKKNQLNRMIN
jgi:hypothetical protein